MTQFSLKGHTAPVYSVALSPDGQRLVSGSMDKTLKVWDTGTGQAQLTLKGHTDSVTSVAISADGRRLVSGSRDGTVKVWTATMRWPRKKQIEKLASPEGDPPVAVNVCLPLFGNPGQELEPEAAIQPKHLRELGNQLQEWLQQAADILEKLLAAGWTTQLAMFDIILLHKDVQTREEAERRLQMLGIDPHGLMIVEEIEEEDP